TMLRTVKKLWPQVMISSPAPISSSCSATSTAAVADDRTRTGRPSHNVESAASNRSTQGPLVMWPERRTSPTAATVASSIKGLANFSGGVSLIGGVSAAGDEIDTGNDETDAEPALHGNDFP